MAYNEKLAHRVRVALADLKNVEEKKMMGGLTFMVDGKMCAGIVGDEILVRLNPVVYETALERDGCRAMDFTGKPMKEFVFISAEAIEKKPELQYWMDLALDFNRKIKSKNSIKKG